MNLTQHSCYWKMIGFWLLMIISISAQASRDIVPEKINQIDTLDQISMIFNVRHGELNTLNIKNHPSFSANPDTYLFNTLDELQDGLELSAEGIVSWSPSSAQFLDTKQQPIIFSFSAKGLSNTYIVGSMRILAQGELVTPQSTIPADSISTTIDEDIAVDDEVLVMEPLVMKLPTKSNWDSKNEGEEFSFELKASGGSENYKFEIIEPEFLMENLDQYGVFSWTPDFDVASAEEMVKSIPLQLKLFDTEGNETYLNTSIYVRHVNRPPNVSELPTFYIQFNSTNDYVLKKDGLVFDPDGDSIVFKPVLKELPQGMTLNTEGVISWKPSTRQFNYLSSNPTYLSFTVQDYPAGDKAIGQIKIAVSQADLPPQITMIPSKEKFEIKENEELEINFFVSDPNGDDDLLSFGFVTENNEINDDAMERKENSQYEFKWTPGYNFIKVEGEKEQFDISFFAIDKESNRTQKNILVTVEDTEDLVEKDRVLYDQYRTVLERAWDMVSQLNEKEKELEKLYRHAKKGKKNRAISTASLGALTGLSPIFFMENPDGQKVAAGLGGTATATIGTLEASNVIGEPPSDIMRDLNYVSQKRNDLLVYGNVFASRYALPLSKRDRSYQSDLRSLSIHLNLKDVAKLELDATWENSKDATSKNIKRVFKDFNADPRFEDDYQ